MHFTCLQDILLGVLAEFVGKLYCIMHLTNENASSMSKIWEGASIPFPARWSGQMARENLAGGMSFYKCFKQRY